ncbi:SURF1 family protein [Micromonospora sp. NPDC050417]|uniref:SURF1 family cytochrome oxidase biogenesis protein n=1 Tax=Micromonospora sp. NPDC050417 TaxID=3364280 RepID=UPI0037BDC159
MYRFLFTPRWLGIFALTLAAATVMVLLGNWQLSRYRERSEINERIDAADRVAPAPLADVLPTAGGSVGVAGPAPDKDAAWTRVTVTGRYDNTNTIVVRGRTVDSRVGFEVVTPLLLADGSAVLVDHGWVPPPPGSATAQPELPAIPTGQVTVVGRVHLSESKPGVVDRRDGKLETRRIALPRLAGELPYPVYGAYLLLDEQTPAADPTFAAVPIQHENNWQNAGYVVQWWLFALMTLYGFGWLARREALGDNKSKADDRTPRSRDRAAEPA